MFLNFLRVGSSKNHSGETNAFFPLFLPEVKSILHSSMPKLTKDSKNLDFFKFSTADIVLYIQLKTQILEK